MQEALFQGILAVGDCQKMFHMFKSQTRIFLGRLYETVEQKKGGKKKTKDTVYHSTFMATKLISGQNSLNKTIKRRLASKKN